MLVYFIYAGLSYIISISDKYVNVCSTNLVFFSLWADHTGQVSAVDVRWTRQWPAHSFDRVDHSVVLTRFSISDFWRSVPTNVTAAFSVTMRMLGSQITSVFLVPAIRTLCFGRNHKDSEAVIQVTHGTRCWVVIKRNTAGVACREDVIAFNQLIFNCRNISDISRFILEIIPVRILRQTEEVTTAASLAA